MYKDSWRLRKRNLYTKSKDLQNAEPPSRRVDWKTGSIQSLLSLEKSQGAFRECLLQKLTIHADPMICCTTSRKQTCYVVSDNLLSWMSSKITDFFDLSLLLDIGKGVSAQLEWQNFTHTAILTSLSNHLNYGVLFFPIIPSYPLQKKVSSPVRYVFTSMCSTCLGGFNTFEKHSSTWIISSGKGWKYKSFETTRSCIQDIHV